MRLIKNIICLIVLMVFTLFHTQISFAADSEWYWISSDDKYSKYFWILDSSNYLTLSFFGKLKETMFVQ